MSLLYRYNKAVPCSKNKRKKSQAETRKTIEKYSRETQRSLD